MGLPQNTESAMCLALLLVSLETTERLDLQPFNFPASIGHSSLKRGPGTVGLSLHPAPRVFARTHCGAPFGSQALREARPLITEGERRPFLVCLDFALGPGFWVLFFPEFWGAGSWQGRGRGSSVARSVRARVHFRPSRLRFRGSLRFL